MRCRLVVAACVVVGATASAPATASPLFELVGDVGGMGGMTARVSATGPAAAYFNPALLVEAAPGFHLSTYALTDQIGVTVAGRGTSPACSTGECDVPEVAGRGPESFRRESTGAPLAEPTVPTTWLQNGTDGVAARPRQADGSGQNFRMYQTVGLITKLLRNRITLGLYAMIPLGEFTTAKAFYNDEREQYFSNSLHPELYSDRLTATSLAFGGGFRVHKKVTLGMTFTLSLANSAAVPVYVSNLNDLNTLLLDSDIGVQAAVAPHFGVVWDALPKLRVTGTLHTRQAFEIETGFDYFLASGTEQSATLQFTHAYMPVTAAAGASYVIGGSKRGDATLLVNGVVKWARWSKYKDRHSDRASEDYRWSNTLSASVGARYVHGNINAGLDLAYQPSPVPPQTGRTNYVDNDRAGGAVSADYHFTKWGSRFTVGVNVLAHHLINRSVTKFLPPDGSDNPDLVRDEVPDDSLDVLNQPVPNREGLQTNNPGFPGFSSNGWIIGSGVRLSMEY